MVLEGEEEDSRFSSVVAAVVGRQCSASMVDW